MAATATFDDFAARLPLTRDPAAARRRIELLEHVLERAVVIPGTTFGFGLDSVIGLIPVAGDLIGGAVGVHLVLEARSLGVPRLAVARMLANVGVDTLLGMIPFAGDAIDLLFRSNRMNLRIIKRHLDRHHPASATIDLRAR